MFLAASILARRGAHQCCVRTVSVGALGGNVDSLATRTPTTTGVSVHTRGMADKHHFGELTTIEQVTYSYPTHTRVLWGYHDMFMF